MLSSLTICRMAGTKNERKATVQAYVLFWRGPTRGGKNCSQTKPKEGYHFVSAYGEILRCSIVYLLGPPTLPKPRLLLAVVAILWIPVRFSQAELRPSMMATISSATRRANMSRPLPRDLRLEAASRIHSKAVRRRWRRPNGTGICKATPPPAAPRCERIRMRGAMLSTASVR